MHKNRQPTLSPKSSRCLSAPFHQISRTETVAKPTSTSTSTAPTLLNIARTQGRESSTRCRLDSPVGCMDGYGEPPPVLWRKRKAESGQPIQANLRPVPQSAPRQPGSYGACHALRQPEIDAPDAWSDDCPTSRYRQDPSDVGKQTSAASRARSGP